jgi:SSS family solute:Na+ symporter
MWAVAVTDFFQILIIAIGLVVLLVVVLVNVGGWGVIAPQLPEHTFRLVPLEYDAGIWLNYVRLWVIFGVADLASQSLMQRVFAADSDRTAQYAFYLAGVGHLLLGLIPVILGIIAIATMPGLDDPQTIVPTMAVEYLHPIAIAIFVGAILAAIMSSADSALLAAASLIGINLAPAIKGDISSNQKLKITRIAIPIIGIVATYVALEVQLILELMIDANSFLLSGVVGPYIAGVWWARANRTGTLSAMAAGFSAWVLSEWMYPELAGDVVGFGVSLVTIYIVTLLTQKTDPPKPLADEHGVPINLKGRLGIG